MHFPTWFLVLWTLVLAPPHGGGGDGPSAGAILRELVSLRTLGSVLLVAAHPDDENNRLLAYLAHGRGWRTAYLSLTRGDGGQNLIGSELGSELGVIRTQEILAARRIDGGRQFFSRARDFGFSKDSADTLNRWDRKTVLADVVRMIRTFRPDIVITRFSVVPGETHGHHTASAVLAREAFALAGNPTAFPEQLGALAPWQPKRILWNSFEPTKFGPDSNPSSLRIDAGGYDPLLGESFGEIGARARSMHKSQGTGRAGTRGTVIETFQTLDGDRATTDLLDGVDTSWARIRGGEEIERLAEELVAKFDPRKPVASVPTLLLVKRLLAAVPEEPVVLHKRQQLDGILQACLGLHVETVIPEALIVPGEKLELRHTAIVRTDFPVRWLGVRYPNLRQELVGPTLNLITNEATSREVQETLPESTPLSHPYWLREAGTEAMFKVTDPALLVLAENPPVFPVDQVFEVGGQSLHIRAEPVQVRTDPVLGEIRRKLDTIPPVSLHWPQELELFAPSATKRVTVEVIAARAGVSGNLELLAPAAWKVEPVLQEFRLTTAGERGLCTFQVTAPPHSDSAEITASATVAGRSYRTQRIEIRYDHIPTQILQPPARLHAVSLDVQTRGHRIGYVTGAGDLVDEGLARLGYEVTALARAELAQDKLRRFDAIVVGVRAFNTRTDLDAQMPALFEYVAQGGTVLVQYNTARGLLCPRLAPYAVELSDDRVTNAAAPVTLLAKDHPALLVPNQLAAADFEGWVQERARYVPRSWNESLVPLLAMGDPGEKAQSGTLLVARYGKGHFVHTSLSLFRQLPAGVPGAYRLLANLIALGK